MKVKKIIKPVTECLFLSAVVFGIYGYATKAKAKESLLLKRYKKYYGVTSSWLLKNLSNEDSIKKYLESSGYNKIAVYGMGSIAELLSKQFEQYTDMEIKYYIDRNGRELVYGLNGLEVVDIDGMAGMEEVDLVIVTAVADYDDILGEIRKKYKSLKVVSLEEIIN
ncbi:MAG: hypothetical protein HFI34_08325 [Lachnospiraceae bacterium]|nr:hypothetical protein [Lachnospiraceae bacterium]